VLYGILISEILDMHISMVDVRTLHPSLCEAVTMKWFTQIVYVYI
jgi:hypothetical protein